MAGRYRLLDRIGSGGMSQVWRAHDDVLDREVAIKVLNTAVADPGLPERIRVEARSAARLRHPNVVEVHDYGQTGDGVPYVVMELVDGHSLADVLRDGALPWRSAATACAQVAAALAAAHARGVVHRDVKPGNVMVTSDGVKLVDFGISATIGEADGIGGEVFGTPAYLAPERLRGGRVRPASDVYALGLLLYLTLAGHLPWTASTTTEMLSAHRYLEPDLLPPVLGLPFEVADLCRRCTAKNPADRPSAEEAAKILADAAGLPVATPLLTALDAPTAAIEIPPPSFGGRRRGLVGAGALALVLTATGAMWFGGRPGPGDVAAVTGAAVANPPSATLECAVGYVVRSATDGRLSTAVTITNTGTTAAGAWKLAFALPNRQQLLRGWTGNWSQIGHTVQLTGKSLPAGGKVSTGFDARYAGATTLPAQFTVNGAVCEAQLTVAGRTAPTSADAAAKPASHVKASGKKDDSGREGSGKGKSSKGRSSRH
ncbi:MAG TPA: serine/threonine-protein kinase [Actinoplanes sp.]|nr:serine/threonine-protein kinase [Actinoplanes sp.]